MHAQLLHCSALWLALLAEYDSMLCVHVVLADQIQAMRLGTGIPECRSTSAAYLRC